MTNLVVTPPSGNLVRERESFMCPPNSRANRFRARVSEPAGVAERYVKYTDNLSVAAQKTNFAPRIGIAYAIDPKRSYAVAIGIFYGGLESIGGGEDTVNYPWVFTSSYCTAELRSQ